MHYVPNTNSGSYGTLHLQKNYFDDDVIAKLVGHKELSVPIDQQGNIWWVHGFLRYLGDKG